MTMPKGSVIVADRAYEDFIGTNENAMFIQIWTALIR